MLRAHVSPAGPAGLAHGVLDDTLGPGRQPLGRRQPGQSRSHDINDRRPGPLGRNGLLRQAPVGRPRLLPQETQQQVFAAHIAVSQLLRRRLGQPKSVLRPGGESVFIHVGTILTHTVFPVQYSLHGGFYTFLRQRAILPLQFFKFMLQ